MLTFRKITFDDKSSFDRILNIIQPETSDLTFTNLVMWQFNFGLLVTYLSDLDYWLLIAKPSHPKWKPFFLPPVGDWNNIEALKEVYRLMKETAGAEKFEFQLRRIPQQLASAIQQIDPGLSTKLEKNTSDYLYSVADLINLAGRKYHSKRNHLNKFYRQYNWEYQKMTPELVEECLNLATDWFDVRNPEPASESEAMAIALKNFDFLGVTGAVLKVDGVIQGITVGERLNRNMVVIHIEKANTEFDGAYTAINREFAAREWAEMEFINREEDMGIEGLRKAKQSYYPVRMAEKFTVAVKPV
ncbi:MAG: DUF2156 domain-containing protein [Firmicutes bacterium]|nr:DUF2156 domain-containing protein [Bacillota bacterium]